MYAYTYDEETGGVLLNSIPLNAKMSKEPRPVYYQELDLLGFDKYWVYDKDDSKPYLWAESNNYFYRGRLVAQTNGGSLYTAPKIQIKKETEPNGGKLRFVNIEKMIEKNRDIMGALMQETIKRIYNIYVNYKNKVDVFYVAFSGGKDSIVTLDLVQKALPHSEFKVLFGDTGMEFPDTYETVDKIEEWCQKQEIEFIRAKSEYNPHDTWDKFGPPSRMIRWCCSVHKTAPQIIAIRKYTGINNCHGMAFVGVRGAESITRSDYRYVSLGEKHKGQYSCNPILEWNSAELYTYIFMEKLLMNLAYKKGNSRAGCLVCPNVTDKAAYVRRCNYCEDVDAFINQISSAYKGSIDREKMQEFLENTGWKARMNGRDLCLKMGYAERIDAKGNLILEVAFPKTDWKEWLKTIGSYTVDGDKIFVNYGTEKYAVTIVMSENGYHVVVEKDIVKSGAKFVKLLKNVFRKAACCVCCHECEADCYNGCISFKDGNVKISEECIHCLKCHSVSDGCLMYSSLSQPKGGSKMENVSINRYSTHAPKMDWIKQYFEMENDFLSNHTLGSMMINSFRKFLRDAGLSDEKIFGKLAVKMKNSGLLNESNWAVLLVNLSYSYQVGWFVRNIEFKETFKKDYIISLIQAEGYNERAAKDTFSSYQRFMELPFSKIGYGVLDQSDKKNLTIIRTPWLDPDPKVILYSLYKFAEACDGYYQFTLITLMDKDIERNGVSPTEIFGLDRDTMERILNGLSTNYPEFINVNFTLDLDTINLRSDKKSADVLELF